MRDAFFQRILNHPWWVILSTLILAAAATMGAQHLVFKSDYRVFFGPDNPQRIAFESMQAIYAKSDNVAFIIAPKNGEVFTEETLTVVRKLTHDAWQIPYTSRVDSISNFQHTVGEEDDLIVADLVPEDIEYSTENLQRIRDIAINEPLMRKRLISEQGHVTVVNATVQLPGVDQIKEVPEVVAYARQLRDELRASHPDIEVYLSGMVMMNTSFAESSQEDAATLVPLMFLVVIVTIGLLQRTISGTFASVVIIILSIAVTMGMAGWTGFYLTGPSASTPTMVLTLAVADCVHILTTFFYEMRHGADKKSAMMASLKLNLKPVFLTSITTAIGFLSMNFSDSPPFADLGNMVAFGVMIAFVMSVTTFPALMMVLPVRVKQISEEKSTRTEQLGNWIIAKRRWLLPIGLVTVFALSAGLPQNILNDDFVEYFDQRVPFRQATDFMEANLSGMTTMEFSIDSGESSGINEPAYLHAVEDFSNWLRAQPETDHVNSITDIIKRLNKNMHADDPSYYRLPDQRDLSAQYLLLYEMSLPYGLDLNNQLNVDKSSTRVIGTFKNITSEQILALEQRINQWFQQNAPAYKVDIASTSLMFAHIGQRNIESMLLGTFIALVLISVLLGIALRSVKFGFISLFPNLMPAGISFGIWGMTVGEVGLGLSVVTGMTLGIVVDDTVHFMSKYLHARREKNASPEAAVRYAFASVGRALWITTFVLVAGFMVLAQSSFRVNSDMGLLTAVTILIALIVDFFLLPPMLMKLDKAPSMSSATNKETSNEKVAAELG